MTASFSTNITRRHKPFYMYTHNQIKSGQDSFYKKDFYDDDGNGYKA